MDRTLRLLERQAYSSGDIVLLARLYHLLVAVDEPIDAFLKLKQYILTLIPDEGEEVPDEIADTPLIELARIVSRRLIKNGYDYYTDRPTEELWDYDNPPTGSSSWAFVEFDETKFWSDEVKNNIVAMSGVYLVDTGTNWHLASFQRSVWLSPVNANVIDVVRASREDEYRDNWFIDNDGHYINRSDLSNAIAWHWVPLGDLAEVMDDNDIPDDPTTETHLTTAEGIISHYAGSPPL